MQIAAEDLEEPEESNGERSVESVPEEPAQAVVSEAPHQINSQQELADQFLRQSPQKQPSEQEHEFEVGSLLKQGAPCQEEEAPEEPAQEQPEEDADMQNDYDEEVEPSKKSQSSYYMDANENEPSGEK